MLRNARKLFHLKRSLVQQTSGIHTGSTIMSPKIALVLSGCGVYDGSEVHEASACLVHLSRAGVSVSMFAPDIPQMHVIDHIKGEEMQPARNVLTESARIARGNIKPLSDLQSADFDGVVFPGGFGAAKNLCSWAVDGPSCTVNQNVERVLKAFQGDSKPIGLTCIAPVLAAKCLPGVEVTVGHSEEEDGKWPYAGTAGGIEQCGAKHIAKDVTEAHVDLKTKVVTTPAFMCDTDLHKIFDGIGIMVDNLLKLMK
ncbi:glutamine amidotransferase-like class 1 domain-containing protein 3, mitochondrial [Clavelina lepadiformis]|uniref:glutamine amidotransferase-like class 1 domain-containing protein 3, mitochondrial n=1 Tax=Clavelina lepadiformis TaxID=159417 RepID=UPI004041F295